MKKDKISFPMCELLFFSLSLFQWGKIQSHNSVFMGGGKTRNYTTREYMQMRGRGRRTVLCRRKRNRMDNKARLSVERTERKSNCAPICFFFHTRWIICIFKIRERWDQTEEWQTHTRFNDITDTLTHAVDILDLATKEQLLGHLCKCCY